MAQGSGSQSNQRSDSFSQGYGYDQSYIDQTQMGFLSDMWQQAQQAAGAARPAAQQVGQIGMAGAGVQQELAGQLAQGGGANPFQAQLQNFQGGFTPVQAPGMRAVDEQIGALGTDIDTQLQRMMGGAGGINSQAAMAGGLGGGRNQVQQGIAMGDASRAFASEAAGLRGQAASEFNQRQMQAQMMNQGAEQNQFAQQLQAMMGGGQMFGQQAALDQAGLMGAGDMAGQAVSTGMMGLGAQFAPLQAFAALLGGPTVLGQGQDFNTQSSASRGSSESTSFGASW